MLRNHLLIIWRNMQRQPLFSIFNIFGLSLGIAACLFIFLYLDFELNYDHYYPKADQIYKINTHTIETREKKMDVFWDNVPAPLGPAIQRDYPEVLAYARCFNFFGGETVNLAYRGIKIDEEDIYAADESILNIFDIELLEGNPKSALDGPNKIILSENMSKRLFKDKNPINKLIKTTSTHQQGNIDTTFSFIVTGVYKDLPRNTQIFAHAIISAETDPALSNYYYNSFSFPTFVLLNPNTDAVQFSSKLSEIYDNYLDANREPVLVRAGHGLIPLKEIHLRNSGGYDYIYIFSAIGLLILLITAISYVNLSTALGARRSTEVGIRKVLGGYKWQLRWQFLVESLFITLFAIFLGIILIEGFVGLLNLELSLYIDPRRLFSFELGLIILSVFFVIGMIGGGYPAFLLAAFNPIHVLKGALANAASKHVLRKALISIQFGIVIFVLISTALIYDQLQYVRQKNLGFEDSHILHITAPANQDKIQVFKNSLEEAPDVLAISSASFVPGVYGMFRRPVSVETPNGPMQEFVREGRIDHHFLSTMDIPLINGRNFMANSSSDSTQAILINEAWVAKFGLTDPIGTKVRLGDQGNPHFYQVVGVIGDFHQSSLHEPIEPQMFRLMEASGLLVKVGPDIQKSTSKMLRIWKSVFPKTSMDYRFLEERLVNIYEVDVIRGKLFLAFSLVGIFITFMGLFGLVSQISTQRLKEVGIRRVLGASTQDIVLLMSRDFMLWVAIAAIPASLGAWYVMDTWLQNFAYQSPISYHIFISIILFTLIAIFGITSLYAVRACNIKPADSLRND